MEYSKTHDCEEYNLETDNDIITEFKRVSPSQASQGRAAPLSEYAWANRPAV